MTPEKTSSLEETRHSLAHLLAAAVKDLYGEKAMLAIGPAVENGFYYDIQLPSSIKLGEGDLKKIEKKMREILPSWSTFEGRAVTAPVAKKLFPKNPFKKELIAEIQKKKEKITIYKSGNFEDLCRGGHVKNAKEIDPHAFVLDHIAGAYWRGDEKNPMLTRIYGLAFNTKKELDEYLVMREEAKKRDHKKLGKELDLFTFSDVVGKGLPLFTPKGSVIRRELERFVVDEEIKRGYLHVYTPDIAKVDLYKKSGHYPYYKDSMYAPIEIEKEQYILRPMTCPHHFELYLSHAHSYRELPLRIAEVARLYRFEQSGELSGLQRVRSFCLADAHIICTDEEQAIEEVSGALDLIEYITGTLGLIQGTHYWYRLSLGNRNDSKKYYKDDAAWDKGEDLLRKLLAKRNAHFVEAEDQAAFYGPKIDIQMRNVNGKEDTAFTVQYDFCMPKRFNLVYTGKDGEEKQAFVIHRSSIGALERIMAFLIEHYAGAFPLWLAPVQVAVLPVSEKQKEYAKKLKETFVNEGFRVELHDADETLGKRIRNAELQKIPYTLIAGEKEQANKTVNIRHYGRGQEGEKEVSAFINLLQDETKKRRINAFLHLLI